MPGALPLPYPGRARWISESTHEGVRIMTTGKQLVGLLLLSTALTHPGAAFAQDAAEDAATDEQPAADDAEQPADDTVADEQDISVPGGDVIFVTGRVNRDPTRGSTQVLSVLSSEQIARTGE